MSCCAALAHLQQFAAFELVSERIQFRRESILTSTVPLYFPEAEIECRFVSDSKISQSPLVRRTDFLIVTMQHKYGLTDSAVYGNHQY